MLCNKCNNELNETDRYCGICGARVVSNVNKEVMKKYIISFSICFVLGLLFNYIDSYIFYYTKYYLNTNLSFIFYNISIVLFITSFVILFNYKWKYYVSTSFSIFYWIVLVFLCYKIASLLLYNHMLIFLHTLFK